MLGSQRRQKRLEAPDHNDDPMEFPPSSDYRRFDALMLILVSGLGVVFLMSAIADL